MGNMYDRIVALCEQRGIRPGRICADTGLSRGLFSDLKAGRTKTLSAKNARIIADYLGVSVDYLMDGADRTAVSEDQIKFALFGGDGEITDEMYQEVLEFAAYLKQRRNKKE